MMILYLSQRLRSHALTGGGTYDARVFQRLSEIHDVVLIGKCGQKLQPLRDCLLGAIWSYCPDYDRRVEQALERETARSGYDLIWADGYYCAPYLRRARGLPSILMTRDSQTRYHRLRRRIHPSFLAALSERRQAWFEKRFYPLASRVVFLSEQDAQFHRDIDHASRCVVFPAAVDAASPEFDAAKSMSMSVSPSVPVSVPTSAPASVPPSQILFTGAMNYEPNSDAAIWFARKIMPLIAREAPQAQFIIAGHSPGAGVRALESEPSNCACGGSGRIRVTGFVEDLRSLVGAAAVFVSPLRFGAGVKTKLLEAMAMGKAIVATPLSADGIAARDGQEMLFASTPEDFARCVLRLLNDAPLRARLGAAARQSVLAHHTWGKFFDAMDCLLAEVTQKPNAK